MSRKKKPTKKYTPRNEFRWNNSPSARHHPAYVFGETGRNYKSLGLTTEPNDRERKIQLSHNPDSSSDVPSFVRVNPVTAHKEYYSEPLEWEFSVEDRAIIRHLIKDYKRRAYRRPKKKKK